MAGPLWTVGRRARRMMAELLLGAALLWTKQTILVGVKGLGETLALA